MHTGGGCETVKTISSVSRTCTHDTGVSSLSRDFALSSLKRRINPLDLCYYGPMYFDETFLSVWNGNKFCDHFYFENSPTANIWNHTINISIAISYRSHTIKQTEINPLYRFPSVETIFTVTTKRSGGGDHGGQNGHNLCYVFRGFWVRI
jgi:hypothetical protein